jgi:hypothetical protein
MVKLLTHLVWYLRYKLNAQRGQLRSHCQLGCGQKSVLWVTGAQICIFSFFRACSLFLYLFVESIYFVLFYLVERFLGFQVMP